MSGTGERAVEPRKTDAATRIIVAVPFILSALSNLRYGLGRRSPWDHGHQNDVGFTPFTANFPCLFSYWAFMTLLQIISLAKFLEKTPNWLLCHFTVSNTCLLLWSYLFARSHYILAELVICANLVQLLYAYVLGGSYKIRPLLSWLVLHPSMVAFPIMWSLYLLMWCGAVMFGARNLFPRLVCNLLIWDFLCVPGFFLLAYGDYSIGFAGSWIALALGLGQLLVKVFGLQWIFALIIAAILAFVSFLCLFISPAQIEIREVPDNAEHAPLLENDPTA